ncbi:hypothetical protein PVAND_016744 [Polypedilum vanderplanki]|uniref:Cytochrome P450 n=1 Tax=Polypedilum vanderplanki TaxID=319348 RepID=A0A9J6BGB7_POLVA|nr:hypothetical protein PVAND_016744 [Polypedilum vanderplanki]
MIVNILLYIVFSIAAAIYFYFKRKYNYFKDRGIPHIKPKFPMGNLQGIGSTDHIFDVVCDVYNKFKGKGPIIGLYSVTTPIYLITDLELIKKITIGDFNYFINRGGFVNEKEEPLTAHLFTLRDDKWRFIRNKLSAAFSSGKMKAMYFTISDKGRDYVELVSKAVTKTKSIDIKELTNRFTIDIVSSVAFGMESNTMKYQHPELVNIFHEIFDPDATLFQKFFIMASFPRIAKALKLRFFSKQISDFFMNVVGSNIESREKLGDNRQDFLNMLIQLKNKGSIDGEFSTETRKISMNDVMAQSFVFFFAGADTSSSTISLTLAELAHHTEVQEKLRTEILEKTKEEKDEISYETLQEMTYLNQVVNEILRMYSSGSILIRQAAKDYKVENTKHIIPKGADVWISMIGIHYDEKYWKNPYKFDPERFTQEEIAKRPNYCYAPFGDGPRACIGMQYALLTVKFGVATIIKNFKVTPNSKMKYPIKLNPKATNLEPIGGYQLDFEKV